MFAKFLFSLLFSLSLTASAYAQVSNNDFENRLHLSVDGDAIHSTTKASTVEWQCVNKSLTRKCLVYHNDQWFTFTSGNEEVLYINLSAQRCKRQLGVQLILIEGNPCTGQLFRIRQCHSKLPQHNTYVKVDSLKAGTTYMINVDGFLGDDCGFEIAVSRRANGFPLADAIPEEPDIDVRTVNRAVKLKWRLDEDEENTAGFVVVRNSGKAYQQSLERRQPVRRNALGAVEHQYFMEDTLTHSGFYQYKIYQEHRNSGELSLLSIQRVRYDEPVASIPTAGILTVPLAYAQGQPFEIIIADPNTGDVLQKHRMRFDSVQHKQFVVDVNSLKEAGHRELLVICSNFSADGAMELYFRLSERGEWVVD